MVFKVIGSLEESQQNAKEGDFQKFFQQWRGHWSRCLYAEGQYFDADYASFFYMLFLLKIMPELRDEFNLTMHNVYT
jgi:hypothetical protein